MMAMKKMVKCQYHGDGIMASLHPSWTNMPELCVYCHGKLEYEETVRLYDYKGNFAPINGNEIYDYESDVWIGFKCECGDTISLSGDEGVVCSCGRIYKLSFDVLMDIDPIHDAKWLIEESNKR